MGASGESVAPAQRMPVPITGHRASITMSRAMRGYDVMEIAGEAGMSKWVRICSVAEAPGEGQVAEAQARDFQVCIARIDGTLHAMDNLCPHRQGPLGQGWIENGAVVCPWHAWAFDVRTGEAGYPEGERVMIYPLRIEGEDILVDVESN